MKRRLAMNDVLVISALGLLALGAPAMSPLTVPDSDRSGGLHAPRTISQREEERQAPLTEKEMQAPYAVAQREDIQAPLTEGDVVAPFVMAQREEEWQAPLVDHELPAAGERRAPETPRLA
jgi:hypothetical protein